MPGRKTKPLKRKKKVKIQEQRKDGEGNSKAIQRPLSPQMKSASIPTHYNSGIKRIYSPFNKFTVERQTSDKKSIMSPLILRRGGGLSSKEKSYIICSCQTRTSRYMRLKNFATEAIKKHKIFTLYGASTGPIRKALIERGWVEKIPANRMNLLKVRQTKLSNSQVHEELEKYLLSNMVERCDANFVWGHKDDIPRDTKQNDGNAPITNRLKNSQWTTKQGLCQSLRESYWYYIEDVAEFDAPRTYINVDSEQKEDFADDYKLTACTSLLKWILAMNQEGKLIFTETGKISLNVIVFALNRCKEFLSAKQNKDIDQARSTTATAGQWNSFLKKYYILIARDDDFEIDRANKLPLYMGCAKLLLREMLRYRPQLHCEGFHNIWIIKPAHCSRGRGIRMASKLGVINNLMTKTSNKYVVQKYIEEPMLIHDTKFDIRQYYLITNTHPLELWMYKDCYLKFSTQKYNLRSFHESIHLTNNAVQKKYKNCEDRHKELPQHNMWDLDTYKQYLRRNGDDMLWDNLIYPAMKKIIVGIMLTYQDSLTYSKNCFELYGCDFILDKDYKPWLIEINSSPDLAPTTQVTAKICPEVLSDVIKVVIDHAHNPKASTGKFECIYRQPMTPPHFGIIGNELVIEGVSLPLDYFYQGQINFDNHYDFNTIKFLKDSESVANDETNESDRKHGVESILEKFKDMYERDIKDENSEETKSEVDENIDQPDMIDSKSSIGQSSTSLSSSNLVRKGIVTSEVNVKKNCNKLLKNYFRSAVNLKCFQFSELADNCSEKRSCESLSKEYVTPGTSYFSPQNNKILEILNKLENKRSQGPPHTQSGYKNEIQIQTSPLTCISGAYEGESFTKQTKMDLDKPQTIEGITKRIYDFLQKKENEYNKLSNKRIA